MKLHIGDKLHVGKEYYISSLYDLNLFTKRSMEMNQFVKLVNMTRFRVTKIVPQVCSSEFYMNFTIEGQSGVRSAYLPRECVSMLSIVPLVFELGRTYEATPESKSKIPYIGGQALHDYVGIRPFQVLGVKHDGAMSTICIKDFEGNENFFTLNSHVATFFKIAPASAPMRAPECGEYVFRSRAAMELFIKEYPQHQAWAVAEFHKSFYGNSTDLLLLSYTETTEMFQTVHGKTFTLPLGMFHEYFMQFKPSKEVKKGLQVDKVTLTISNEKQRLEAIKFLQGAHFDS